MNSLLLWIFFKSIKIQLNSNICKFKVLCVYLLEIRKAPKIRFIDFDTNAFQDKQKYSLRPQRDYFMTLIHFFFTWKLLKIGVLHLCCVFFHLHPKYE